MLDDITARRGLKRQTCLTKETKKKEKKKRKVSPRGICVSWECLASYFNGSQLAKMKKSIPDMPLP